MSDRSVRLVLAMAVILQNTLVVGLCLVGVIPKTVSVELLFAIVNGAGTAQGFALSYFFGSSAGSTRKDETITKMADNQ